MHSLETYNEQTHLPILYAAALDGVDIEPMPGAQRYVGYGNTKHGYGPACIIDDAGTQHVAEPHLTWFPWVRPQDKIINFRWGMKYLAQSRVVLLNVEKKQIEFFEHFVRRGVLRKIGIIEDLPIVEEIHMYQYKRGVQ